MPVATIYRIPLRAPSTVAREIKATTMELEPVLSGMEIKRTLVSK
jgi:hypothetical protein